MQICSITAFRYFTQKGCYQTADSRDSGILGVDAKRLGPVVNGNITGKPIFKRPYQFNRLTPLGNLNRPKKLLRNIFETNQSCYAAVLINHNGCVAAARAKILQKRLDRFLFRNKGYSLSKPVY